MSAIKSSGFAYLFALFGGVFGIHHLYLGRTQHALLWLTTFGGFGFGIIDELFFRLNKYVREVNHDQSIIEQYEGKIQQCKSPAFEFKRFFGQSIIAAFYGLITYYAFPNTWHENSILSLFIACCTAFSIALGIYLTGTLGPRQCSFIWPLLGALLALPFLMGYLNRTPSLNIAALISSWIFEWKIDWNKDYFPKKSDLQHMKKLKKRTHLLKRTVIVVAGGILFTLILTSAICQNLEIKINDKQMKIKDVLGDYIRTREYVHTYQRLVNVAKQLYTFYRVHGFDRSWEHIWESLYMENNEKSYEILQLDFDASQEEIENQCRILPRKWHPDRYRDPEEKHEAQNKFVDIQQACSRLLKDRRHRQTFNGRKHPYPS